VTAVTIAVSHPCYCSFALGENRELSSFAGENKKISTPSPWIWFLEYFRIISDSGVLMPRKTGKNRQIRLFSRKNTPKPVEISLFALTLPASKPHCFER
jgi:hypothetical protein